MKWMWAVLGLLVIAVLLPLVFRPASGPGDAGHADVVMGLPWQIEHPSPGQSHVMGMTLGSGSMVTSTLADAMARFGNPAGVAIVTVNNETPALEAYFDNVSIGPLDARAVLSFDATPEQIANLQSRAEKEYMGTGTVRYKLSTADLPAAERLPLRGIVLIPAARLDADVVVQRFGQPAERVRQGETLEHFLYPAHGLDVVIDTKGKEVLQYVAPSDFDRLASPLGGTGRER